ncbi:DUF5343 domain-containing protein [Spongiibacter marinus]|uniref:DUF5343 domain-containing protein n=1 Tax=Spongiibacter marinus TaxID=354246 RepID=UPI0035BE15C3
MANIPYVTAPGNVTKALNAIANAATPERISQDFVKEVLKIPGGSGDQMTAYLKKVGLASSDGSPTPIYKKFRNPSTRGEAGAEILKHGYAELYKHNEYAHEMSESKLKGLIIEVTGHEHDSSAVTCAVSCFKNIKAFADFSAQSKGELIEGNAEDESYKRQSTTQQQPNANSQFSLGGSTGIGLNLGYTINLNLPATSDIAVFNAIFKSLKENLLSEDDG